MAVTVKLASAPSVTSPSEVTLITGTDVLGAGVSKSTSKVFGVAPAARVLTVIVRS